MKTHGTRDKMLWDRALRHVSLAPGVTLVVADIDPGGEGTILLKLEDGRTVTLRRYADVWAFIERSIGDSGGPNDDYDGGATPAVPGSAGEPA